MNINTQWIMVLEEIWHIMYRSFLYVAGLTGPDEVQHVIDVVEVDV